jgi:GNAT superfamily N-acetyltransferase
LINDVPEMHRVRLAVRENVLSDPSKVPESETRDSITASGRGWVFEQAGELLGFSIALRDDPSIWALFVLPGHEGRGIGHALLEEAIAWLWSEGARSIWLTTDAGTRAERFYRDRGWVEVGRKDNGEIRFELKCQENSTD